MVIGGGVLQSYDEVPAGHSEIYLLVSVQYILTFQAGLSNIEVGFKVVVEDDEPEPLRMEHFYFPLGLLVSGTLLSILCFIAEIIFHCLRKPQTVVEEPGVTQSTQEAEDGLNSNVQDIENTKV